MIIKNIFNFFKRKLFSKLLSKLYYFIITRFIIPVYNIREYVKIYKIIIFIINIINSIIINFLGNN